MFISANLGEGEGEASASADSQRTSTPVAHAQPEGRGEGKPGWRSGRPPSVGEGSPPGPPPTRQQVDPRLAHSGRGLVPGGSQATAPGDEGVAQSPEEEDKEKEFRVILEWLRGRLHSHYLFTVPLPLCLTRQAMWLHGGFFCPQRNQEWSIQQTVRPHRGAKEGDENLSMLCVEPSGDREFPGVSLSHGWLFLYPSMFISANLGEGEGEASASADSQRTSTPVAHAQPEGRGEGKPGWRSGRPPSVGEGSPPGPPPTRQQVDPRLAHSGRGLVPGGSQATAPGDEGVAQSPEEEDKEKEFREILEWLRGNVAPWRILLSTTQSRMVDSADCASTSWSEGG
ncbi:hypothetical protein TGGT1_411440 [Toxoplasma gondii GT1]|uniref:Uncharacterized protein n=1 Tax=Toxoplasma gondii (strain ATCC 50853 / GT1) TaxID=507601 RepID=S7UF18_TOXGG|nr:hypothetical protein TGGT1_411440 [Toxoplasma gondii GT1]